MYTGSPDERLDYSDMFPDKLINEIILGDCIEVMAAIPDAFINCIVTSPPYFGLRDYGKENQIGLESSPDEYVSKLVDVFRSAKRILKDDGTLWLNLGDSYGTGTTAPRKQGSRGLGAKTQAAQDAVPRCGGMAKQLFGIPWKVAFALQADGWYLRQDIIWHKPNPMPESVTDRCTKSHEYLFLLSKNERYYFDNVAIKEDLVRPEENKRKTPARFGGADKFELIKQQSRLHSGNEYTGTPDGKRNKRDVWSVAVASFKGAHFATFPKKLIEPCILAGCPENGIVFDPFMGAGTTAVVATENNRNFIGSELNEEYCKIAEERVRAHLATSGMVGAGTSPAPQTATQKDNG